MGRLDKVRERLRRMYDAGRESLRAARERAEEPNGELRELTVTAEQPEQPEQARPAQPAAAPPEGARELAAAVEAEPGATGPAPAPGAQPAAAPVAVPIDDAVPRGLRIAAAWAWRLIVIGAVVYALLWLVDRYMLLIAPLMISLLLAGLLMPAQRALLKVGINRSIGALLVVVAGLAALGATLALVINQFLEGLDDMVAQIETGVEQVQELAVGADIDLDAVFEEVTDWIDANTAEITGGVVSVATGTLQFVTGAVLVLVVTFFFLRDGRRIADFMVGMLPQPARAPVAFAGDGAWRSLSGYVRATVLVALVDAVGIGVGLQILSWVMNFPSGLVLPLAALVFLGGFVPIVGAFVSGTVAVLVALVSGDTLTEGLVLALIVLGIVLLVQQLESNVLQPLIVSKMVRIHPLAVIVAVMAGILLAGIIGALIAVPVVAVLNTAVRRLHAYHLRHRSPSGPAGAPQVERRH